MLQDDEPPDLQGLDGGTVSFSGFFYLLLLKESQELVTFVKFGNLPQELRLDICKFLAIFLHRF